MDNPYTHTSLTPIKVARSGGFIDWDSQPSMFKHYPKFLYRYKYAALPVLKSLELSRCITSVSKVSSTLYQKLSTPSAGNLHPIELYVQIRAVEGVISGIYHIDAGEGEIVLIKEIDSEGVEPYVGLNTKYKGMIFLISCVPFRSAWKYADRAIRYCYLDTGHQIGAIDAALKTEGQTATILSLKNTHRLNRVMGFRDEEFISSALCVGEITAKEVKEFKQELIYTSPSDYIQTNLYVNAFVSNQQSFQKFELTDYAVDESTILKRRSSRYFEPEALNEKKLSRCIDLINASLKGIECFYIILKSETLKLGLYKNNRLLKEGDFTHAACGMLLDQSFIKNASLVNVMCSRTFDADSLIKAGAFAHAISLDGSKNGIGFSGIGAFYDKELQDFLGTDMVILYVNVIGSDKIQERKDEREN